MYDMINAFKHQINFIYAVVQIKGHAGGQESRAQKRITVNWEQRFVAYLHTDK